MSIQVFGTRKCKRTRAAERFFSERRIRFQYVDLGETNLSPGEFDSVVKAVGAENLIDTACKEYEREGLRHLSFDIEAKLRDNPRLLLTPIVRNGPLATAGNAPDVWKGWLKSLQA